MRRCPVLMLAILTGQLGQSLAATEDSHGHRAAASQPVRSAAEFVALGDALMQQTREFVPGVEYADARRAYVAALKLEPDHHEAMVGLAWASNSAHDFSGGERWAREALAVNPWSHRAHALLGDAALELGDYDAAFEHYQRALDLQPDLSSYSRAAQLLWITGDPDRARALLVTATAQPASVPEHRAWCYTQLGLMSWHQGNLNEAERQVSEALRLVPDFPHALAAMARIHASRGATESAAMLYQRAIQTRPSPESLSALGDLMVIAGADEQASALYARAFRSSDHDARHGHSRSHPEATPQGDAQLARLLADHGRNLGQALREAERAYRGSRNIYVADALAWCHYKAGRFAKARDYMREALRFSTPDASLHYHAGMISWQLGEREEARQYLERALALNARFDPLQAPIAERTLAQLR